MVKVMHICISQLVFKGEVQAASKCHVKKNYTAFKKIKSTQQKPPTKNQIQTKHYFALARR